MKNEKIDKKSKKTNYITSDIFKSFVVFKFTKVSTMMRIKNNE